MELYVVRHAPAFAPDPVTWPDDSTRPLTPDGEKRFRRAARGLRTLAPSVDVVLSSPLVRAWRTAELLSKPPKWPAPVACEALTDEQPPEAIVEVLQEYALARRAVVVGHEPQLPALVSYLLTGEVGRVKLALKKGGVAALTFSEGLEAGSGTLLWVATPRMLRQLAD